MKILLVSDTHFTAAPQDEYRFDLFPFLAKVCGNYVDLTKIVFLGDLTDFKDRHSGYLINRISDSVADLLSDSVSSVVLLQGNHDYDKNPEHGTFRFLRHLEGCFYWTSPCAVTWDNSACMLLPHSREPSREWKPWLYKVKDFDFVFVHATFSGSVASNGVKLDGVSPDVFKGMPRGCVYAGDVHVPQTVGKVTYVGAPYSIRFNDEFEPRILVLDLNTKETESFTCLTLRRFTLEVSSAKAILKDDRLRKGDQVKVRYVSKGRLSHEAIVKARSRVQEACDELGLDLHSLQIRVEGKSGVKRAELLGGVSVSPDERDFRRYVKDNDVGDMLAEFGKQFL